MNENNKRIENRAKWQQELQHGDGKLCEHELIFAMRDNYHEFTLDIQTILECLLAAEREGAVPELSAVWWSKVMNHYRLMVPEFINEQNQEYHEPER